MASRQNLLSGSWATFIRAADADMVFDLLIIRNKVFVGDGPVVAVTVAARCFEVVV
jgi:hypothetical protein